MRTVRNIKLSLMDLLRLKRWQLQHSRPPLVYLYRFNKHTIHQNVELAANQVSAFYRPLDNTIHIVDNRYNIPPENLLAHESLHYALWQIGELRAFIMLDNIANAKDISRHPLEANGLCRP